MDKKLIVLKSMRTKEGAEGWLSVMKGKYPTAWVEKTEVVMEDVSHTVVDAIKKEDVKYILQTMLDRGFMEMPDSGTGPHFTDKWYKMVDRYVNSVIRDSLKSVDTLGATVISAIGTIMKALDVATENPEFGHALRDNKGISDTEAKAGFADKKAPPADVRDVKMDGDAVTEAKVKEATYKGDHNVARKSVEAVDKCLYLTFESLEDAKAWRNPDIAVYQVVPVVPGEEVMFGKSAKYVVRGRFPWYESAVAKAMITGVSPEIRPEADEDPSKIRASEQVSEDRPLSLKSVVKKLVEKRVA